MRPLSSAEPRLLPAAPSSGPSALAASPGAASPVNPRGVDVLERAPSAVPAAARAAASRYGAAFERMDTKAMDAAAAPGFRFFDPTLPSEGLTKTQSNGYWSTLAANPHTQLKLSTSPVTTQRNADGQLEARFTWKADYRLGADANRKGQAVHNEVATTLTLSPDGQVLKRVDDFDTGRWLAQAAPFGIGRVIAGIDDLFGTHLSQKVSSLVVKKALASVLAS